MSSSLLDCYYVPLTAPSRPWLNGAASIDDCIADNLGRLLFKSSACHIVWADIPDAAAYRVKITDPDNRIINIYNSLQNEFIYTAELARQHSSYTVIDGYTEIGGVQLPVETIHFRALRQFTVSVASVDASGLEAWGDASTFYIEPSYQHGMSIFYSSDIAFLSINTSTANYTDVAGSTTLIWAAESIATAESPIYYDDADHLYYDSSALILSALTSQAITLPRGSVAVELASATYDAWTSPRIASGASDSGLPWHYDYVEPVQFDILQPIIGARQELSFGFDASSVIIHHNTNSYPPVRTLDSAGTQVFGAIVYNDSNTITITFSAAFSGTAYL